MEELVATELLGILDLLVTAEVAVAETLVEPEALAVLAESLVAVAEAEAVEHQPVVPEELAEGDLSQ